MANVTTDRNLVNRAYVYNTATPSTTADILTGAPISVVGGPHNYLRVYACFTVAVKLEIKNTVGATTVTELLNGGTDLVAGAAYLFDVPIHAAESINFAAVYSSGSPTTNRFIVDEYSG